MSEKDNMLSGLFYRSSDTQLVAERTRARQLLKQFNTSDPADEAARLEIAKQLFGQVSEGLRIEPPFYCDYGSQIYFGENVFINFNCVILDCAKVQIGNGTQIGPAVQIYTATHPLEPAARADGKEFAAPVCIGQNVWIGGGAIILPGVKIGNNSVVAAGAVVTRDVAANTVVVGNPAKPIRQFYGPPSTADLPANL